MPTDANTSATHLRLWSSPPAWGRNREWCDERLIPAPATPVVIAAASQ
jgi:hypothetical protein